MIYTCAMIDLDSYHSADSQVGVFVGEYGKTIPS